MLAEKKPTAWKAAVFSAPATAASAQARRRFLRPLRASPSSISMATHSPQTSRFLALALLEFQDGENPDHGEGRRVCNDDCGVQLHDSIRQPEGETRRKQAEHLERQVTGGSGLPGLFDLRHVA